MEEGEYASLGCIADGTPTLPVPQGNDYDIENCVCDAPIFRYITNEVLTALKANAEIGCSILFGAFDLILNIATAAIRDVGLAITVGMEEGAHAANTIGKNGQDASTFAQRFETPCGDSNYMEMIDGTVDPLRNVPDSDFFGVCCKGKMCSGRNNLNNKGQNR